MWHPPDLAGASDPELSQVASVIQTHAAFFDPSRPLVLARAPGRLDVMGGIADYSGSLVLELPLNSATWVAVQSTSVPTVGLLSTADEGPPLERELTLRMNALVPIGGPLDYREAHALLTARSERAWAAYVAGALVVLHHEHGPLFEGGLRCLVHSDVPIGKGLSSSAAIEVATLRALTGLANLTIGGRELALLAQRVENLVVGAPCGVMDQMTSACGRRDHLLVLLCQPAELQDHLPLPPDLQIWGIDSGIRHAVSGADYTSVRVAAFMGYRIVAGEAHLAAQHTPEGRVVVKDVEWGGYLANMTPSTWRSRFRERVPEVMDGRSFLARYEGITDPVTRVDPSRSYAVRACTEHPIDEHHRVRLFHALLEGGARTEAQRELLGELMYESHASYGACGLGSDGTDWLVARARQAGPAAGIYGAKITGGGSGGTVAVLCRPGSRPELEKAIADYERETGRRGAIYGGSSPGAMNTPVRTLVAR